MLGVLSAVEHILNETAMQARTLASKRQAKAIKASHGPRVSPQPQARGFTRSGVLMDGTMTAVVLDGMKTAKGCVAQL